VYGVLVFVVFVVFVVCGGFWMDSLSHLALVGNQSICITVYRGPSTAAPPPQKNVEITEFFNFHESLASVEKTIENLDNYPATKAVK